MGISLSSIVGAVPVVGNTLKTGLEVVQTGVGLLGGGSGSSHGPYVNSDPPAGWPYTGDWKVADAPGQIPTGLISQLLAQANSNDINTLRSAYLRTRDKAGPYWDSIVLANPRLIGIAAAGGDDYNRNADEATVSNTLSTLLQKYGIAMVPQVSAGSTSVQQQVITALERAWDAAKTAAGASLAQSGQTAAQPLVAAAARQQVTSNAPLLIGAVVLGAVAVLLIRR